MPTEIIAYEQGPIPRWSKLSCMERQMPKGGATDRPHLFTPSYVPLSVVPTHMQQAVLMSEDVLFFEHGFLDLNAIRKAVVDWLWHDKRLRGASTVTQQLAKNLFLNEERTLWRKVREARYAYWLEQRLSKQRILELYLNVIEFGPNILGIEDAARYYFGVSTQKLSQEQAVALAAAIPAPFLHNPKNQSKSWQTRVAIISHRLKNFKKPPLS